MGTPKRRVVFLDTVLHKIRAIPGVVNAGASSHLPLRENDPTATFYSFPGQSESMITQQVALIRFVTRDYFPTIGAQLREGRFFEISDARSESQMVIVNETFANRNFPQGSALGARFRFGRTNEKGYWYTIVGVVKEVREVGMAEALRPAVYSPTRTTERPAHDPCERDRDSYNGGTAVTCFRAPRGDLVGR